MIKYILIGLFSIINLQAIGQYNSIIDNKQLEQHIFYDSLNTNEHKLNAGYYFILAGKQKNKALVVGLSGGLLVNLLFISKDPVLSSPAALLFFSSTASAITLTLTINSNTNLIKAGRKINMIQND